MSGSEERPLRREAVAEGLSAVAFVAVGVLLAGMVALVSVNAAVWFWPSPLWQVQRHDGTVVVGVSAGFGAPQSGDETRPWRLRTEDHGLVWMAPDEIANRHRPDGMAVVSTLEGRRFARVSELIRPDGGVVADPDGPAIASAIRDVRRAARRAESLEAEAADLRSRLAGRVTAHRVVVLGERLREVERQLADLRAVLETARLHLEGPGGARVTPLQTVERVIWPNELSWIGKTGHAAGELVRFLTTNPRSANTAGGIFPALFGTVMLVFLMTIAVMPMGVLCAVYMTEYARDGLVLRIATHAVNNLAGVPSIVFGMFGLAFFVYGLGGAVDRTLFADRLPTPTFGTGGILWASLTLALLTVPVVVVATREGLENVPRDWRAAAQALGATKWQALRTIVLPASLPGILTGLILAISRAAGEVAPLMLTGVVKMAHSLPVDGAAPYLHLDRKFMHLGYHIWDVSMQSPNVEAAKPMAFASALVLLGFVVVVNLVAFRARVAARRRYHRVEA